MPGSNIFYNLVFDDTFGDFNYNWLFCLSFQYLEDLKRRRARVIIADVYDEVARSVMCEAYKLGMTAQEGYVWFLPSWLSLHWYNTTHYNQLFNETVNCTMDMMIDVSRQFLRLTSNQMLRLACRLVFQLLTFWNKTVTSHAASLKYLLVGTKLAKYRTLISLSSLSISN